MKITVLCSSPHHPINRSLDMWIKSRSNAHEISLLRDVSELRGGDILFLISCSEIVTQNHRANFGATLVIHASDLPKGRGWSPYVWQILAGSDHVVVTLLEAEDKVDSGAIWGKKMVPIPKHFLVDEINRALFDAELELMDLALELYGTSPGKPQPVDVEPTYYKKRTPEHSRLDADKTIADQFDLIRVCDPDRYPAFFELHGHRYKLTLEKL